MNDELLTIQQAADLLGVSTKTLRRWEAKGVIIPQRTIGNQRRYGKSELTELFNKEKGKVTPTNRGGNAEVNHQDLKGEKVQLEKGPIASKPIIPVYVPQSTEPTSTTPMYFKATQFSGAIVGIVLFLLVTTLVLASHQVG